MIDNHNSDLLNWPAQNPATKLVSELVPYARNSRTHSDEQIAQIAASIREWGFTNPILIDESNNIIAGHGRILAAQKLGLEFVPCIVALGWTDAQRRAYVIADNKLALNAGWDDAMLKVEFDEIEDLGFDLGLVGFSLGEIANICDNEEEVFSSSENEKFKTIFEIAISFDNEEEQQAAYEKLSSQGYLCRVLSI